jgi:hypothetical protein
MKYRKLMIVSLLAIFVLSFIGMKASGADKTPPPLGNYDVEPVKDGGAGDTYLLKVWSYTKNLKRDNIETMAMKNAVHALIFKGFTGNTQVPSVQALTRNKPNVETTHKEFFDSFFATGGKYRDFATVVSDGIAAEDRIKMSGGYKVAQIVSVKYRALRDYLIEAGIIEGIGGGLFQRDR